MADEPKTDPKDGAPADPSPTPAAADQKQSPTDGDKPEKNPDVTFTPEQQRVIDDILSKKLGKVKERSTQEFDDLKKQFDDTSAKLREKEEAEAEAARQVEDAKKQQLLEKGKFEEAAEITKRQHEESLKRERDAKLALETRLEKLEADLRTERIDVKLTGLLAAADAFNPEEVAALIKHKYRITLDTKTGEPLVNDDPTLSLKDIVRDFLAERPNLLKTEFAGKAGAGSKPAPGAARPSSFTLDQIRDPEFRKKHEREIIEAARAAKKGS